MFFAPSGLPYLGSFTWVNRPSASANKWTTFFCTNINGGLLLISDGVNWTETGNSEILLYTGLGTTIVSPAATFIAVSVADNAGNTQLSSAGVHGLTTSPAVGKSIYISAGTGWTPGLYSILSVDSITAITVSQAFASQGTPTIALVTTEIPLLSLTVFGGIMGANGTLRCEMLWEATNSANTKTVRARLAGTVGMNTTLNSQSGGRSNTIIRNQNSASSQKFNSAYFGGYQTSTVAHSTGTVNTAVDQQFIVTATVNTANEILGVSDYRLFVQPA